MIENCQVCGAEVRVVTGGDGTSYYQPVYDCCCKHQECKHHARNIPWKNPTKLLCIEIPQEFVDLCKSDNIEPHRVLRGFIADLCEIQSWQRDPRDDGYSSNGSDERLMAREYYDRVGYPFWPGGSKDPGGYTKDGIEYPFGYRDMPGWKPDTENGDTCSD